MKNISKSVAEESTVIFLHIPKTAGMTLRYIIQHQYRPGSIYELYGLPKATYSQRINKLEKLPRLQDKGIKIINSHLGFGLHEYLRTPSTYITFLRDPIERVISFYYFLQRIKCEQFRDMSLEDFVQTCGRTKNSMTKFLSGEKFKIQLSDSINERNYICSSETFELAKRNLKDQIKVIGLTERFDESLILLKRSLGWKIPLYDRNNVSKNRPLAGDISKGTLSLIEKFNEFDIQLYAYAKELFNEHIHQQGSDFINEVESFKAANESNTAKLSFRINTFCNRVAHRTYKELVMR